MRNGGKGKKKKLKVKVVPKQLREQGIEGRGSLRVNDHYLQIWSDVTGKRPPVGPYISFQKGYKLTSSFPHELKLSYFYAIFLQLQKHVA